MNNFKELIVWQKAVDFVVKIYEATNEFPESERFNLISQMQKERALPSRAIFRKELVENQMQYLRIF